MISLLHLNKIILILSLGIVLIFKFSIGHSAEDIWKKEESNTQEKNQLDQEEKITIESPIISDDISKITIKINEKDIENFEQSVIGLFDPEKNNFNLNMWVESDGNDIKKILKRIDKLKLSKISEDILFNTLFTSAYPPKVNLNSDEFLDIKINWLIKKKRINDLENLLKENPEAGKNSKAIKFLIDEYLSSADIKSACEKINFIDRGVKDNYLDKFTIYCLINNERQEEAQLIFDLLKERGFKENFFEDKVNFLLGITDKTNSKTLDDNLLNFYLSHITNENFKYEPDDKTNKYVWRYLSSANLIKINDFEDENIIKTYELAAAEGSFESDEIFNIYLKMNFNFNQLVNAGDIYKNLPNYKARALIYQSILLSDGVEKKIDLAFLLKDLFIKDKILSVYNKELSNILKSINADEIPENYIDLVKNNLDGNIITKVKFDNGILHRSKVIKHFLENNTQTSKTEKDLKSIYKKIRKNKKYFMSIKDIVVLDSLIADGVNLPDGLNYNESEFQLTVPKNLEDLANENQIGLVILKIVEIVGEDKISDLDPETVYFLCKILNDLNLKKIRNNILSEALPIRV